MERIDFSFSRLHCAEKTRNSNIEMEDGIFPLLTIASIFELRIKFSKESDIHRSSGEGPDKKIRTTQGKLRMLINKAVRMEATVLSASH